MEIVRKSKEFNKRELYKLTKGETVSLQKAVGFVFDVDAFVLFTDTNTKGDEVEILAILAQDGNVYTTISETFKQRFFEIVEHFGMEELPPIVVTEGQSNAGRRYIACTIE